jgi:ribosomal protein S18
VIQDLIEQMRSLDLLRTELEGDDWCTETDRVLQEAADFLEQMHQELLKRAIKPTRTLN